MPNTLFPVIILTIIYFFFSSLDMIICDHSTTANEVKLAKYKETSSFRLCYHPKKFVHGCYYIIACEIE